MKKLLIFFIFSFLLFASRIYAISGVEINTATLEVLKTLTGIGDVKAQAIINTRPFSSIDDLLRVKGIGEKTLQKIKDQGLAYVKNSNSQTPISNEIQNSDNETTTKQPVIEEIKNYPDGIFINEIMPSPNGSDEAGEWIELYNSNNSDIDLAGWQIKDTNGTPTTYTFPKDVKIVAMGFSILKRPDTKITLNNDKDGLNLINPAGENIDFVEFTKAVKGQSYNKMTSNWQWSTTPTQGTSNIITTKTSEKALSKSENSVKNNNNIEAGLADLSQTTNISQNIKISPWFLFLSAIILTVISAIVVLFIKLKFQKNVRT